MLENRREISQGMIRTEGEFVGMLNSELQLDMEKYRRTVKSEAFKRRSYSPDPYEYLWEMEALGDEAFGRLCRIRLYYSVLGELPEPVGEERFFLSRITTREDTYREYFAGEEMKRRDRASKAANARWGGRKQGEKELSMQKHAQGSMSSSQDPCNANLNHNHNLNLNHNLHIKDKDIISLYDHDNDNDNDHRESESFLYDMENEDAALEEDPLADAVLCAYDPGTERAIAALEDFCGQRATQGQREQIAEFVKDLGEARLFMAMERARKYGNRNWNYIHMILINMRSEVNSKAAEIQKTRTPEIPEGTGSPHWRHYE